MINLRGFRGFAFHLSDNSREALKFVEIQYRYDIDVKYICENNLCPEEYVPCGSVEWCEKSLNNKIIPNYYPAWCSEFLFRKIWVEDKWIIGKRLFVKPADSYKRFTGFVTTGTYKKKKKGKLVWSEVVCFKNEWRYYISGGKVLCSGWYCGDENKEPKPPKLNFKIPETYFGALDMGELPDGKIALVESQHPFACGHYSDDHELYYQWLIDGWEYMMKNFKK